MSALENAKKMGKEEIREKIAALHISDAGICGELLADKMAAAFGESEETDKKAGVAAALNNADTDRVLLEVLKNDPEKVFEGLAVAGAAMETEDLALYVPEGETELAESLAPLAEKYGVSVKAELLDVRANEGNLLMHLVTAADLCDAFNDTYVPGVYVSVNGEPVKKVSCGAVIGELADTKGAKAILMGYRFHKPEDASLTVAEAEITNGVLKVLTSGDCIVNETEKRLIACRKQSCGKCVFCREGLIQLQYMHKEMTEGRGKPEYLSLTKEIGGAMCFSTPCTMGQNAAVAALGAMEEFAGEYEAHIKKKKCPAAACTALVNIYIDPKRCSGCGECRTVCEPGCIEGKDGYIHMVDDFDCTRCGKCVEVCGPKAVVITTGRVPKVPWRFTKVGRFRG